MARKFYRNVFSVEVLSEEPLPDSMSLDAIHYEITNGDYSGRLLETVVEEVNSKRMAELLLAQGSDPEFFGLDAEGNEID